MRQRSFECSPQLLEFGIGHVWPSRGVSLDTPTIIFPVVLSRNYVLLRMWRIAGHALSILQLSRIQSGHGNDVVVGAEGRR